MITDEMILQAVKNSCGVDEIDYETELLESGILDSYGFIVLLSELEEIGAEIEPTEVGVESFSTPLEIIRIVRTYQ